MIVLKTGELADVARGLNDLISKDLPVRAAYWTAKIAKKVASELRDFNTQRIKLLEKHSEKDSDGKPSITNDNHVLADVEHFRVDFDELCGIPLDIGCMPISLSDLGNVSIKPGTMILLDKIIVEDNQDG